MNDGDHVRFAILHPSSFMLLSLMVTLHDSLLSSSARKSPIRKRPDLVAGGNTIWAAATGW